MRNKNKLLVRWSKRHDDFLISSPSRPDGHLATLVLLSQRIRMGTLYGSPQFDLSFIDDLVSRGYDPTTLRFTIEKKKP